jgi:hypothetical protein
MTQAHAVERREPGSPTQEAVGWSHSIVAPREAASSWRGWLTCRRARFIVWATLKGRTRRAGREEIGPARGFPFFLFLSVFFSFIFISQI